MSLNNTFYLKNATHALHFLNIVINEISTIIALTSSNGTILVIVFTSAFLFIREMFLNNFEN